MSEEQYNLALLKKDPNHIFELKTLSDAIVPITMKGILELTPIAEGKRLPNGNEAMMLLDTILGQRANPYAKECGLMPVFAGGFHYEVWVAAQVRMRKAQAQNDYEGYKWGWITKDFTRHEPGKASKANPDEIIGVWGEVYRKGKEPYYHETYLNEFSKKKPGGSGSWDKMERGMILKVNRDQTHKFAYADCMGNLNTMDELKAYNDEPLPAPKNDIPPRDERRRPIESKAVEPTETKKEAALSYQSVLTQYVELQGKDFVKFCATVLCVDEDEVMTPDSFTTEMLERIKREMDTNQLAAERF